MERLTEAQAFMLARIAKGTLELGHELLHARREEKVSERLAQMGLVTLTNPTGFAPWGTAIITEAGRAALRAMEE
jgi:hypothetical protein